MLADVVEIDQDGHVEGNCAEAEEHLQDGFGLGKAQTRVLARALVLIVAIDWLVAARGDGGVKIGAGRHDPLAGRAGHLG